MSGKIQAKGKSPEVIEKELKEFNLSMENYHNPFNMMMNTFLKVFPIGLIITVLCAMLMRRKVAVTEPA